MQLFVQVKGDRNVVEILQRVQDAADPGDLLDEVQAVMLNRIRTRFLNQEDPDGNKWPVSQASIRRAAKGRGGGTLFDTGRLFHSIQASDDGPSQRRISTDVPYARKHQFGEDGLPKREFLGFSDDDINTIQALVTDRIRRGLV